MKKQNDFIISISKKNDKPDILALPDLANCYSFNVGNSEITLKYSNKAIFSKSVDEKIIILFSGNIYQDDLFDNISMEKYLLEKYFLLKKDFVKYLNGSFCIFMAYKETGEVYFATDRLNTRKLFNFKKGKEFIFATDINYFPLSECNLSYGGISSYLINGAIYNNLTLFEEITILESGSLHKIEGFRIMTEKYWDYYFTNEYENKTESELSYELIQIYLKSIKRRIKGKKNIFISLSGGYDSRAIAAIVKETSNINSNILCFSHNFGEDIEGTDSGIAYRISEKLGYEFKLVNSYSGNPFHTFKYNAELGQGLAYFCVESDAWEQINKDFTENENSILFVGDMNDGTFTVFHGNKKRALERTQIYESGFLKEFSNYFDPGILKNLCESWDEEYNKILEKVSAQESMINLLDYLYIDQRIPHVNSIARECFQMPFIETVTPYYDIEVLDFMRKLPTHFRDNKKLHRLALETKYPEIFNMAYASGWGYEMDWMKEIKSNSDVFMDNIKNTVSMLDNIILPDTIIKSIFDLNKTEKKQKKTLLKFLHNMLKNIFPGYYKMIEKLPGGEEFTRKAGNLVNTRVKNILPKILMLRMFLNRT